MGSEQTPWTSGADLKERDRSKIVLLTFFNIVRWWDGFRWLVSIFMSTKDECWASGEVRAQLSPQDNIQIAIQIKINQAFVRSDYCLAFVSTLND